MESKVIDLGWINLGDVALTIGAAERKVDSGLDTTNYIMPNEYAADVLKNMRESLRHWRKRLAGYRDALDAGTSDMTMRKAADLLADVAAEVAAAQTWVNVWLYVSDENKGE